MMKKEEWEQEKKDIEELIRVFKIRLEINEKLLDCINKELWKIKD